MRFVETPVFTRAIVSLLQDTDYHSLQKSLVSIPERGLMIPGSGGLRKIRWARGGKGKRGGLRAIYFWENKSETFYMLYAYAKNDQEELTAQQLRVLQKLV